MGLFSFLSKNKQGGGTDDDHDVPVKPHRSRRPQASEDPVDPVLPEKKRARRRLIGATALVLAAIIGLPMIFDSEPKPLADDIEIHIPSRDQAQVGTAFQVEGADEPGASMDVPDSDLAIRAPVPIETVSPTQSANAKPAPAEKQATANSANSVADAVSAQPSKEKPSRFIVQVAAVATRVKANELQDRLKKAGVQSYSQKITTTSGERFRVRVGPFNSREEAEKMRIKLGKLGLSGALQPV